jgi:hypothetical protein
MLLTVTAHLAEREEFYNQSKLIIEVNKMNIDEIVSRIVELTFSGSE